MSNVAAALKTAKTAKTPARKADPAADGSAPTGRVMPAALAAVLAKRGAKAVSDTEMPDGVISTGLLSVDTILGGGWAKQRLNELGGDSGVGKTTMALATVAYTQKHEPGVVVWLDPENSFVPELAEKCGVNLDTLIYHGPAYAEVLTDFALDLVEAGGVSLIVIDSIGAFMPKKKMESTVGTVGQPAQRARAVGDLAERLIIPLCESETTILAINHLTGLLQADFHGNQRTTTKGGKTWNYLKSTSLNLKAAKTEQAGDAFIAEVTAEVLKCRRAPRGATTEVLNVMGQGYSALHDLIVMGARHGIVEGGGAWLTFAGRKFNGRAKLLTALQEEPELERLLRDTIQSVA